MLLLMLLFLRANVFGAVECGDDRERERRVDGWKGRWSVEVDEGRHTRDLISLALFFGAPC